MLIKLAFKNLCKSLRDYAIYFLTLTLGVSVFYMFGSIYTQREIMHITESADQAMTAIGELLQYISLFVAVILGFLIVYANGFFLRRRKKELGVYLTLGMTRARVSLVLLLETSLLALAALGAGLLLGVFGSLFMSVFTANLFEADLTGYKFLFSLPAAGKSIVYFAVVFVVVAVFNTLVVGKVRLIDLLSGGRKNETPRLRSLPLCAALFALSLALLAGAYTLILRNSLLEVDAQTTLSLVLGAAGTLLFFFSLSGLLLHLIQRRKKLYYKGLNLFVLRQLSSRINTNFVSLSVVCLTLLVVIVIFSTGYSAQDILSEHLRQSAPYDLTLNAFYREGKDDAAPIWENLPDSLRSDPGIARHAECALHVLDAQGGRYGDYDLDFSILSTDVSGSPLYFLGVSEYEALCALQGKEAQPLEAGEYHIVFQDETLRAFASQFRDQNLSVSLGETALRPSGTVEPLAFTNMYFGGIVFVVEDARTQGLQVRQQMLNLQCTDEAAAAGVQRALDRYQETTVDCAFLRCDSKQDIYADALSDKAMVAFLAIYLGFVFMIASAAVLAVQQLSETADNQARYDLLRKLGADRKMRNRALLRQILAYFLLPLALAVVHSVAGLAAAHKAILEFGQVEIAPSLVATAFFLVVIYGAYFAMTYWGSRSLINREPRG